MISGIIRQFLTIFGVFFEVTNESHKISKKRLKMACSPQNRFYVHNFRSRISAQLKDMLCILQNMEKIEIGP